MSFSDTIFLFFLALILFGPKKLPEMARQAGRLLAELRRASNEFRSQIETEIAHLEVEKKAQETLTPSPLPMGTVASASSSPAAIDPVPNQLDSTARLAAYADAASGGQGLVTSSGAAPQSKPKPEPQAPTSQESHV